MNLECGSETTIRRVRTDQKCTSQQFPTNVSPVCILYSFDCVDSRRKKLELHLEFEQYESQRSNRLLCSDRTLKVRPHHTSVGPCMEWCHSELVLSWGQISPCSHSAQCPLSSAVISHLPQPHGENYLLINELVFPSRTQWSQGGSMTKIKAVNHKKDPILYRAAFTRWTSFLLLLKVAAVKLICSPTQAGCV